MRQLFKITFEFWIFNPPPSPKPFWKEMFLISTLGVPLPVLAIVNTLLTRVPLIVHNEPFGPIIKTSEAKNGNSEIVVTELTADISMVSKPAEKTLAKFIASLSEPGKPDGKFPSLI